MVKFPDNQTLPKKDLEEKKPFLRLLYNETLPSKNLEKQ